MEKVQWNSINKKQNGLRYSKNDKSSTLPSYILLKPNINNNQVKNEMNVCDIAEYEVKICK